MAEKKMVKFLYGWGIYQQGDIAAFPEKKAEELLAAKVILDGKPKAPLCAEPTDEELKKLHAADTAHYEGTKATAEGKYDRVPSQHPWEKHYPELHRKITAPAQAKADPAVKK